MRLRITLGLVLFISIAVAAPPLPRSPLPATTSALAAGTGETISYAPDAGMVPLVPARLLDTREALGAPQGPVGADTTINVQITGQAGIPTTGVGAVVINVTAVGATAPSYVTAWPAGVDRPLASNLNVNTGDTIPNLVIVKLGTGGTINLYNYAGTLDLLADAVGWFPEGTGLQPLVPTRLLDTREALGAPQGPVGADTTINVQITGQAGIPTTGVGAVVINVTAVGATAPSYVTAWPAGVDRPLASNLNVNTGDTIPNLVIVKLGTGGTINLYNYAGTLDLLADAVGWFPEGTGLQPLVPTRLLDTREALGAPQGPVGADTTINVQITGQAGIPTTGVGAVVINVTAVGATAPSYVTAWPAGVDRPLASNLNVNTGDTIPNLVIVKLGTGGTINLYNYAGTLDLLADAVGWFPEGTGSTMSYELQQGSVLAGAGDVVSYTGDSEIGATVVMSGSADLPPVGGHLSVFPNSSVPEGLSGVVVSSTANADGTTTLVLAPANLQDIFAELDFSGTVGAGTNQAFAQTRHRALAAACSGSGSAPLLPTISLSAGNFGGEAEFSLRDRHARILVEVTISLDMAAEVGAAFECTFPFPTIPLGVIGPMVTEMGYEGFVSIGGAMTAGVTIEVPVKLGFEYSDGEATNLSGVSVDGEATLEGPTFIAAAGARAVLSEKIFGILGAEVAHGPEVSFEYEPLENSATVNAQYRIGLDFVFGRWGVEWGATLAEIVNGPYRLLEVGNCLAWVGSIDFSLGMDRKTIAWYDKTDTFEHDYHWTATSSSASLLNAGARTFGPDGSAPDSMSLDWSGVQFFNRYTATDTTWQCSHSGGGYPGSFIGTMYDTDFHEITEPSPGQTVYLDLLAYYDHAPQTFSGDPIATCADEASGPVVMPQHGLSLSPDGYSCLSGTVAAGGECLVVATVSADGRHIDVDLTMNGVATTMGVYDEDGLKHRTHNVSQHLVIHLELKGSSS